MKKKEKMRYGIKIEEALFEEIVSCDSKKDAYDKAKQIAYDRYADGDDKQKEEIDKAINEKGRYHDEYSGDTVSIISGRVPPKPMTKEEHLQQIKDADTAYYDGTDPIMSDQEYDILRATYIARYGTEDLDYVPGKPITTRRFKHPIEVTSLAKVDENDVEKYDAEIERLSPITIEPKYDGLTVVAYPDSNGGYFYVTRGSGVEGDILPSFIPGYDHYNENKKYAIRGEAYLDEEAFEKMNADLIAKGEKPKSNPRNAAAGILNPARKDMSPYLYLLSFACYDVIGMDAPELEKLKYIHLCTPFEPTISYHVDNMDDNESIRKFIKDTYHALKSKGVPIDGMVIKTNQKHSLEKWGSTAHHPRNAVAIKAKQTAVTTTLLGVHWQVGKTGAVTPVADFEPVEILGSTVSQASLSNPDEIKRLNLHVGDEVAVIKAKEIVPKIVMNYGGGSEEIMIPEACPSCGEALKKEGPLLRCMNPRCPERLAQMLAFMAKKNVLDLPGWAIETCRKIVKVTDPSLKDFKFEDLFWYMEAEFVDYFGEKTAKKLADAMQYAVDTPHPFRNWLPALCVDGIGHTVADKLLQKFHTIDAIKEVIFNKDRAALSSVSGFGDSIVDKLLSDEFKDRWMMMESIFFIEGVETGVGKMLRFADKSFVLTGKMPKKRSEYEAMIRQAGGTVAGSVSKNTDYLVIADVNSTSTKAEKARKLGTKLISPEELEKLLVQE